jgi:hypothetical protein
MQAPLHLPSRFNHGHAIQAQGRHRSKTQVNPTSEHLHLAQCWLDKHILENRVRNLECSSNRFVLLPAVVKGCRLWLLMTAKINACFYWEVHEFTKLLRMWMQAEGAGTCAHQLIPFHNEAWMLWMCWLIKYAHVCMYVCMRVYVCMHVCVHVFSCEYVLSTHVCIHAYKVRLDCNIEYAHIRARIYIYIYTFIHTHTHTHTHIYIYMYMWTCI